MTYLCFTTSLELTQALLLVCNHYVKHILRPFKNILHTWVLYF